MKYIDVVLPLPLDALFTYSVPEALQPQVQAGKRVLVPFGAKKTYMGIVVGWHEQQPGFQTKPIKAIADAEPIVPERQLKLWQWIADYYMAPLGDVMAAALPAGLKAEEGYRPKMERCITLPENLRDSRNVTTAQQILKQARKQRELFDTYLKLSHWDQLSGIVPTESIVEITAEELLNECKASTSVLKNLIDRQFLKSYEREVGRLNLEGEPHPENIKPLSEAQQDAYNQVVFSFLKKNVTLLHGVTSSGKTEIYIHLIEKTLQEGKQVLYLLPEIALTVQMMSRLKQVFGNRLGIYHSKYSDAERVEIWQKQLSAHPYDIILGARSAVFLPFQHLGLVIVDEEHETSFKQQEPAPRYHARSAAIVLAQMYGAKTLLGTATPSAESLHNATTGKYGLVRLATRYAGIELPEVRVVDVKDLRRRKIMRTLLSPDLEKAMREALASGRQVILFQNRRGFAPMVECRTCGWVPKCKNCDVSLTYHRSTNILTCHYCGYSTAVPTVCPCCEEHDLSSRGYGTEKVEELIANVLPEARIARMDLDTTRTRNAYDRIIGDFSAGRTNVLIGTQMVTKGLDFDRVAVVGILDADSMLNTPDFRAYEHAFAMMSQVSGRAGRKGSRGLVILQTKHPELPIIQQVVGNDWSSFYHDLLEERQMFRYPPFFRLVSVFLRHKDDRLVETAAHMLASMLRQSLADRVLGPDKPAVARVKTLHIRKILIKLEAGINLSQVRQHLRSLQATLLADKRFATLSMYYDVDPL